MKKLHIELKKYDDEIKCLCTDETDVTIGYEEYPHIYNKVGTEITNEDFDKALDVIITFFMQKELFRSEVNLDEREKFYSPVREMTMDDIERELGYKIKIVK